MKKNDSGALNDKTPHLQSYENVVVAAFLDQIDAVQSVTNRVQIVATGRWPDILLVIFVTSSDSKFQTIILNYLEFNNIL